MSIRSVAIIGSGPSGLTSLYELLHTSEGGVTSVGENLPVNPHFTNITVFEQNSSIGGVWNSSLKCTDPPVPTKNVLNSGNYNDPYELKPPKRIPSFGSEVEIIKDSVQNDSPQYSKSAVYNNLYTNIPRRLMRFSYSKSHKETERYQEIKPFLTHQEIKKFLDDFTKDNDLLKYIRFNTEVESVKYDDATKKWRVISREFIEETGKDTWRSEYYDGVIVAGGRLNIPYFPLIPGLSEYIHKFPNVIRHAKAFRTIDNYKDKNILIVGGSVSCVDLIQYLYTVCKKIYVSRRTEKAPFEWMESAINSDGIITKPEISSLDKDGSINFTDGTTLEKPDQIILATGYHFHFPYLERNLVKLSSSSVSPSNSPSVQNLYLHTFYVENPSLAFVGIPLISTVWHAFEAEAAAIVGVWSGASKLPSVKDQKLWEARRLEETANNIKFQIYTFESGKSDLIDPLAKLSTTGRLNPLDVDTGAAEELIDSLKSSEKIFYSVKEGNLKLEMD